MSSSNNSFCQLTGNQLEEEDEIVILPQVDNSALIARYKLSLVGRMFHRDGRSIESAFALLPKENIWNVAGRVRGIPLGNHQEGADDGDMDWDEETAGEYRVYLEWETGDNLDAAYFDTEKSLLKTGDNLDDDDLLGVEVEDLRKKESEMEIDENVVKRDSAPNMGLGQSKQKETKRKKSKRLLLQRPKLQKLKLVRAVFMLRLQKRFLICREGSLRNLRMFIPNATKKNSKQVRSSGIGHGGEVFPLSLKNKVSMATIDTGGPSNPPGLDK